MSLILNIDTSLESASVSIAENGIVLASRSNEIQKDHAAFLHHSIKDILDELALDIKKIDAIALANGPGSYTGLRVGLASAKGLCYALKKPLITIGTLNALAFSVISSSTEIIKSSTLFCPMIDARRMEVYTAIFKSSMNEVLPACAMILTENSFDKILENHPVLFFGTGSVKWNKILSSQNGSFIDVLNTIPALGQLSYYRFISQNFADISYTEPLYIKDFFTP